MSKFVVDSNSLQSPKLRDYLASSTNNFAVLTDYALMEALKGDTLASIHKSMAIVSSFPRQIIILKFSSAAHHLRGRQSGLQRRLIDTKQTRSFPDWCRQLALATDEKHADLAKQLLSQGRIASAHMLRIQANMESYGQLLEEIVGRFTSAEIKLLRSRQPPTTEIIGKLRNLIIDGAIQLFAMSSVATLPPESELRNTFLFRFSLCSCFLALHWISVGGVGNVKPSKLGNDIIDVNFATFATFFDGLLSADAKATEIHANAKFFLKQAF